MRSPDVGPRRLLLGKERRELASSRAWLVLLVVLGPLVGHAFITAVHGASPLNGIIVPTFEAYTIAVALFLPFVAIRLVSPEKRSGALKLLLQARPSLGTMLLVKLIVLMAAWVVAWLPGLAALALWRSYGGHLAAPEIVTVLTGHLLAATLVSAVAIAAAAVTNNAAAAAIITLAMTLGAWTLDVTEHGRGGMALGVYTPASALRSFENSELRLSIVLVTLLLSIGALLIAWVWLPPSRTRRQRTLWTLPIIAGVALLGFGAAHLRQSWDLREDSRNSAPLVDARAPTTIGQPREAGILPATELPLLAARERGLLEMLPRPTRSANPAGSAYRGYSPSVPPLEAVLIFYVLWPILVIALWWLARRPRRPKHSPLIG